MNVIRYGQSVVVLVVLAAIAGFAFYDHSPQNPLYKELESKNYRVRIAAVQDLGKAKDRGAIPYLIKRIDHPRENLGIKTAAIRSLGQIGDPSGYQPIVDCLFNLELDPTVRAAAPTALGELGDEQAIEPMLKALNEQEDILIQHSLLHGLNKFGGPRVEKGLAQFVQGTHDATISGVALGMYAQMAPEAAKAHVLARLPELDDPGLQAIYIQMLDKLGAYGSR